MRRMRNSFLVNFFNGIVLLLPVAVTVMLIKFLVFKVNSIILNPLMFLFAPMVQGYLRVYIAKIFIFAIVIITVTFIGWGAKILVLNHIFSLGERLLVRVPIMGKIYSTAKQIFSAILGEGKTIFKQVVLVEYPRKGVYSLGFMTGIAKGELKSSIDGHEINIFIPTVPNPTSGVFLIVPKEELRFLKMSIEDGMKLVISGGAVSPESFDAD